MNDLISAAARCGVETGYHDARGEWRTPGNEALAKILGILSTHEPCEAPIVRRDDHTSAHATRAREGGRAALITPRNAFQPAALRERGVWMLAVQLYGVRSRRNWGIGDFSDVEALLRIAAQAGAAGIALTPLHAGLDGQASPYSPSSRLHLNALAIDVERVPGFPGLDALGLREEVERLRTSELIDYDALARVKMTALRAAHAAFRKSRRGHEHDDSDEFRKKHGDALIRFAAFETLWRQYRAPWWEWPRAFRRPDEHVLATLRKTAHEELDFHQFVQWQADRQLRHCRDVAHALGLPIGLYLDVAVGVIPDGADCWGEQDSLMRGLGIGAPPDTYNPAGQNWGLASFHPSALIRTDFSLLRATLRASMRYAGAVRLDHVIGLNRLFVIPEGGGARDGTYVRFPLEAMTGVVAQESAAARCLVIGEDLGTVPEGFRDVMADWGIWSYRVALFERSHDGEFHAPHTYPECALVSFNTHDLATLSGWSSGHDLAVKRAIGIDPGEDDGGRQESRHKLSAALTRSGLGHDISLAALARFMARTPSRLLVISAEDVLEVKDQPNIPGTIDEHPNWRRKLPVDVTELAESPRLREIAEVLTQEGRSSKGR